ncbi:hypothetical protein BJY00DRAFT_294614 [Aspergillus carlsbadensis]|nr:hypothetical protein BJY00DRAFT_294614 [Aspergillus carlsbadensis]
MASPERRAPQPLDFRRAIICALPREFDAVEALFDEHYDVPAQRHHGDPNFYRTGRLGTECVVLTCLAEMGKGSAASAASTLRVSFPNINLALVVGVCGGVPFPTENTELIMGDVIVSHQVVKFDFGRQYPDRFEQKGSVVDILDRSNQDVRCFLSVFQTRREKERFQQMHVQYLRQLEARPIWRYPGVEHDRLFPSTSRHVDISSASSSCDQAGCQGELIQRARLDTQDTPRPRVHYGPIASGDTVMKSAEHRDRLARTSGIIAFEMEGAGVCNSLSCLIIKGACDYADSHKNKVWQDYAAASAAACAKALLECLSDLKTEYRVDVYSQCLQTHLGAIPASITGQSTADACNVNQHMQSIEEALSRLEGRIPGAMVRRALLPVAHDLIEHSKTKLRDLQRTRVFQSDARKTMFGTILFQTRITEHHAIVGDGETTRTKTTTSFIFHPARWLMRVGLKYGLKALATNHNRTWQYSIRPVHAVPDDSLIFDFCYAGNVGAVQELITRGMASVFDVDSYGSTPLHFAVRSHQVEMASFLISEGADKNALTYRRCRDEYDEYDETPASQLRNGKFTDRVFDMLLLFEDCIGFWDQSSDGWDLLRLCDVGADLPMPTLVRDCLSFLLQRYRAQAVDTINRNALWYSLHSTNMTANYSAMKILLEFDPGLRSYTESISRSSEGSTFNLFMVYMRENLFAQQVFIDRGIDLVAHFGGETPTSRSLRFSCIFFGWREGVHFVSLDLGRLLQQETSKGTMLSQQGWRFDTLRHLFLIQPTARLSDNYAEARRDTHIYDPSCMRPECYESEPAYDIQYHGLIVEPWWEELKHLVKSGEGHGSMEQWVQDTSRRIKPWRKMKRFHGARLTNSDDDDGGGGALETSVHDQDTPIDSSVESSPLEGSHTPSSKPNVAAGLRIEHYYIKYNGFLHKYVPQEYWCFHCLAAREAWELDEGWVPPPEVSHVMEVDSGSEGGPWTAEDVLGRYLDDQSVNGDDPGSGEDAEPPACGRKRKIAEIS